MDWQAKILIDEYKARRIEGQRNYEVNHALYGDIRSSDVPLTILRVTGSLLVNLGRRLQKWGGAITDTPQTEPC